jgi:hypothetical protein
MSAQKTFFFFSKIYDILIILFGILVVIGAIAFETEPYVVLIGLALIAWGGYSTAKWIRDARKGSEVQELAEEREEIERRLEEKEQA